MARRLASGSRGHALLADRLLQQREEILSIWEARVRSSVKSAVGKRQHVLRDSIPAFIVSLASSLRPASNDDGASDAHDSCVRHGGQRAHLRDYALGEVVREYAILRGVIVEALERTGPVDGKAHDAIATAVDAGVAAAITEFEDLRRSREQLVARAAVDLAQAGEVLKAFQLVVEDATEAFADLCFIHLIVEGVPRLVACSPGVTARVAEIPATDTRGPARVLSTGRPDVWPGPDQDVSRGFPDACGVMGGLGMHTFSSSPLQVHGQLLGVITAARKDPFRAFSTEDVAALGDVGVQLAFALENARLHQEAQEAIAVRDEFTAIASHELRTPLTSMMLNLQMMARAQEPATQRRAIDSTLGQLERLSFLVERLLDVTRMREGPIELHLEQFNLHHVVVDLVSRETRAAARAGCRVLITGDPDVDGVWDRVRVHQVVTHLLSNALKYGHGRPVHLHLARTAGDFVQLTVSDEGAGVSPERRRHLFQPFAHADSSRNMHGLGLGLYLVRRLVEAHGGRIRVETSAAGGARFVVELPRVTRCR